MSLSTSRPIRAPRNRDITRAFSAAFIRSTALRRLLVLAFFIAAAVSAHQLGAQEVGTISGRIVDTSGDPLSDVSIRIDGTPLGGATGLDGRYTIVHVPAGAVSLHARRIGFASKTITNIEVQAGSSAQQDIVLAPVAVTLAAQVVTASGERGSVASALDRQRTATGIVNAITAEQIARSPDANAAQAVQRVSGVTIQDGKYVFVRGLGERYTNTSLNGARLPSPESERKVVPLDLFPSGLLQTVTTSKTFTPDQPGDFAGAAVDLQTREFPSAPVVILTTTAGYNSRTTGRTNIAVPTAASELLGFASRARDLPGNVRIAGDNFGALSRAQLNQVTRSFRPTWQPVERRALPNGGTSLSIGGRTPVAGQPVGYVVSGSYGLNEDNRYDVVRSLVVPDGDPSAPPGSQAPYNRFAGVDTRRSVLWGGIVNASTLFGARTLVATNNVYTRSADAEARVDTGFLQTGGIDAPARRTSLTYTERAVRSNQVKVDQSIGGRQMLSAAVTSAAITRREPDRSDFTQYRQEDGRGGFSPFQWLAGSDDGAKRSFSDLDENALSYNGDYRLTLGDESSPWMIKAGGSLRDATRNVDARSYAIFGRNLTPSQLQLPPDQIFDGRFALDTSSVFTPSNYSAGGSYHARDRVTAGYSLIDAPISCRVRLIAGARLEDWSLRLDQKVILVADPATPRRHNVDVLPSAAINISLTESQKLRLSASRTLSRPEYREISSITARDVIGERSTTGNPNLQRALIENYDLRWEMYPAAAELLSVGLFAKRFHDPIERIEVATSGASTYQFVNTKGARNFGVELEARHGLGAITEWLAPVTAFANVTAMHSTIEVGNAAISSLSNLHRPMQGQAPYIVNAGLSANSTAGAAVTLLYNVVGKRIVAAGSKPVKDTYELPQNVLDLSLQLPVTERLTLKVNGRNLLDAAFRQESGGITSFAYRTGRSVQLGLQWQQGR